jgi:hypothetical protein
MECPICLETIVEQDIDTLECGHSFHKTCMEEYKSYGRIVSCPICRLGEYSVISTNQTENNGESIAIDIQIQPLPNEVGETHRFSCMSSHCICFTTATLIVGFSIGMLTFLVIEVFKRQDIVGL